ncbi:hypothetical protein ANN_02936 [Periplaneta americana]|uniref:Uncharacterized protein n=1 Tax=Periplaneta americana TaxID=6978 RepID=A0ABQ8U054_PERAM|nr:hypothetical protein ANN_02936 [Periplaneta americana]
MCKVAQVLEGVPVGEIDSVYVCDIPLFKYARLTSCVVERSFSQYKSLFRDNRHAFMMENLEMTFAVHCNSRPTTSTQVWLMMYNPDKGKRKNFEKRREEKRREEKRREEKRREEKRREEKRREEKRREEKRREEKRSTSQSTVLTPTCPGDAVGFTCTTLPGEGQMYEIRPYLERIFFFFFMCVPHPGINNMRAVTSHGAPPRQPSSCPNTRLIRGTKQTESLLEVSKICSDSLLNKGK